MLEAVAQTYKRIGIKTPQLKTNPVLQGVQMFPLMSGTNFLENFEVYNGFLSYDELELIINLT